MSSLETMPKVRPLTREPPSVVGKPWRKCGEVVAREARSIACSNNAAQKRKRSKALHALTLNTVAALQGIGLRAAKGDGVACGHLLRIGPPPYLASSLVGCSIS